MSAERGQRKYYPNGQRNPGAPARRQARRHEHGQQYNQAFTLPEGDQVRGSTNRYMDGPSRAYPQPPSPTRTAMDPPYPQPGSPVPISMGTTYPQLPPLQPSVIHMQDLDSSIDKGSREKSHNAADEDYRNRRRNGQVNDAYQPESPPPYVPSSPKDGVFVISDQRLSPHVQRAADTTRTKTTGDEPTKPSSNKRCCVVLVVCVVVILAVAGALLALYFLGIFGGVPSYATQLKGEASFNETWTSDLSSPDSSRYQDLSSTFLHHVKAILDNSTYRNKYLVELSSLREGSVVFVLELSLEASAAPGEVEVLLAKGFVHLNQQGVTTWFLIWIKFTEKTTSLTTPTTTISLSFTPPRRTTPTPAICVRLSEGACLKYGYTYTTVSFTSDTVRRNQFRQLLSLAGRDCYEHVERFSCARIYPECVDSMAVPPCRSFCQEFKDACSYPISCDGLPHDDNPALCVPPPDQQQAATEEPFTNPCDGQFLCGNNKCVSTSQACDGTDDCGDYSDEVYCDTTTSLLDCDFEASGLCGYTQENEDHFDWAVHQGHTATAATGPGYDHTHRAVDGHYALAEASGRYYRDVARLVSTVVQYSSEHCLRFYFHMHGEHVEELRVYVQYSDGVEKLIWPRSKDQGNVWKYGYATLPVGTYRVVYEAIRGVGYMGDIAVDDITARTGACPPQVCPAEEFSCSNGNCLLQKYVCDGANDCGDFSEERNCECSKEQFQCGFGMCVPGYQRCDGEYNCPDRSDELNCEHNCTLGRHLCADGTCIMAEWVCDNEKDCPDGSDEDQCDKCAPQQFRCRDYGCVDSGDICDGKLDCIDGSDELECFRQTQDFVVEALNGGAWKPVCLDNITTPVADSLCKKLGRKAMTMIQGVTIQAGAFLQVDSTAAPDTPILQKLISVDACPSAQSLYLKCRVLDCGIPAVDQIPVNYIVHGQSAQAKEWPWQIGLLYKLQFICGGSLVGGRHVITAAHCINNIPGGNAKASDFKITLGSIHRVAQDSNRVIVGVKKLLVHPDYESHHWGSDIAILTLDRDVVYNEYIRPLCLVDQQDNVSPSSMCYTTGWGYTDYETHSQPEVLQEGKMKLWTHEKCKNSHTFINDHMLCAGYQSGYISNCPGDSGGPLVCKDPYGHWKLVGVFSFMAKGCNVPMFPPVFTQVQDFLPWIEQGLECIFKCGNGNCIWDAADICNGVNDCGDFSDELNNCSASVTCEFEDPYVCGYSRSLDGSSSRHWLRLRGQTLTPNIGPTVDFTTGNLTGSYMFADKDNSVLLTSLLDLSQTHCFRFRHMMRGRQSGRLDVFRAPAVGPATLPPSFDASNKTVLYTSSFATGDLWTEHRLDLTPGRFYVGFHALAAKPSDPTAIALDHVELLTGSCNAQVCDSDEFRCTSGMCVTQRDRCNFHAACTDESDETNCQVRVGYECDLEDYGSCGLEQDIDDDRDWNLLRASRSLNNGPVTDHTEPLDYGGHMMYLDTLVGYPGARAKLSLLIATGGVVSCLQFWYSMVSNGTLAITYYSDQQAHPAFALMKEESHQWRSAQLVVHSNVRQIVISGTTGVEPPLARYGYMAVDDLRITAGTCSKPNCQSTEFQCASGECIDAFFTCDGHGDCSDSSDETLDNCPCTATSFRCGDGRCLRGSVRCDGRSACVDGSDETGCLSQCRENEFQCNDGKCKSRQVWCDGFLDCADDSDEPDNCNCFAEQYQCQNGLCILGTQWCDRKIDCADSSDEPVNCDCDSRWQFRCGDGSCIPKEMRCDKTTHCPGGEDEIGCVCTGDQFNCSNGLCLDMSRYCDGYVNCPDGEDEPLQCQCSAGQFQCASGGCIATERKCNGLYDCADHSDEANCFCEAGQFRCPTGLCLDDSFVCDFVPDCDDGADEKSCACVADEYKCDNGLCIAKTQQCDGQDQCGDNSDEKSCNCRIGQHRCDDGECIQEEWLCDGSADCADLSDEANCPACAIHQLQCVSDKKCVPLAAQCDGVLDCEDGYDESRCVVADSSTGYVVEVQAAGEGVKVCYDGWAAEWSDQLCQHTQQAGPALYTTNTTGQGSLFLKVKDEFLQEKNFNLTMLTLSQSCPGGEVLKIRCSQSECGRRSPNIATGITPYIIGGEVAAAGDWPWAVAVQYLGAYRCGGTLIGVDWVLTAAHCFLWQGQSLVNIPQYFTVRLGEVSLTGTDASKLQVAQVEQIFMHADYSTNREDGVKYNDMALLKLTSPVTVTDYVRVACMPDDTFFPISRSSLCYTSGWGFTHTEATGATDTLREAKMRTWTSESCSAQTAWGQSLQPDIQVCAGYRSGHIASCKGDSGSPLVCKEYTGRWILAGVTSQGPDQCGQFVTSADAKPTIYSRVSSYLPWIKDTMKTNKR